MTRPVPTMSAAELAAATGARGHEPTFGLLTATGALPLTALAVDARVHGLTVHVHVRQTFANRLDEAIEAAYIHPLPDRAAVTGFRMTVADRVIDGILQERATARAAYDTAIAEGHRAAIAEENRPDVFMLRVGNLQPGEIATVELNLVGRLPVDDGVATFRHPLVVAPRYVPGNALGGRNAGGGVADDTDAAPDASTISPPVLLAGAPDPVRLALSVTIDPAGLDVRDLRCSLHDVAVDEPDPASGEGQRTLRVALRPGERVDRDFVLRFAVAGPELRSGVVCVPDADSDEGTWMATVVPPTPQAPAPRDVVVVLDRSGSMGGWKMVAARRAAARIVDSLRATDRVAVIAFDDDVEQPPGQAGLVTATDGNRFAAVEFLARVDARGGTALQRALLHGLRLLADDGDILATMTGAAPHAATDGPSQAPVTGGARERSLVLVTDGQVADEDRVLRGVATHLSGTRVCTVGIDRAVNAGLLRRLAAAGNGSCDLVESQQRLDEVMTLLHRRIAAPVLTDVSVRVHGIDVDADATTPAPADCFAGTPLVVAGRYRGRPGATATIAGSHGDGRRWSTTTTCRVTASPAPAAVWARARVRDLEDRYAVSGGEQLAKRIVATSLTHGVLSRFTAFVAVDRSLVTGSTAPRTVVQPVTLPAGWQPQPPPDVSGAAPLGAPRALATRTPGRGAPRISELRRDEATTGGRRAIAPPSVRSPLTHRRYLARRDALATVLRRALGAGDVAHARRVLRALQVLRDDLAPPGTNGSVPPDLDALIDALTVWVRTPSADAAVGAALDALAADVGQPPSPTRRFWR